MRLSFNFIILFLCAFGALYYMKNILQDSLEFKEQTLGAVKSPITPYNTVFAFDIHKVLFATDYPEKMHIFWISTPKLLVLKYLVNPFFLYKLVHCVRHCPVSEYVFNCLEAQYPGIKPLKEPYFAMCNAQKPIPDMIQLAQKLKQQGFSLYLLSNISPTIFADLRAKFPEVFALFDGWHIPDTCNGFDHKPLPRFYIQFKRYLQERGQDNKQIIFIDDKKHNLTAAEQHGIVGIHYTPKTNVTKLLQSIGLS